MKKIIALMITLIMCMTISVIPVMAMETSPCSENAIENASIEATNQPVVASANIIYPTQTTFSVTKTITRIQHQGSASNLNGFIQDIKRRILYEKNIKNNYFSYYNCNLNYNN